MGPRLKNLAYNMVEKMNFNPSVNQCKRWSPLHRVPFSNFESHAFFTFSVETV